MCRIVLFSLVLFTVTGCGGGLEEFPTAKASGQVLCDGKPVANVQVVFAPVATGQKAESGKSGLGNAGADGTFTVSTYGNEDGAVVGKHNVIVITPHPEDFPEFTCNCETDGRKTVQEVEVTADGENNFTINLPARTAASAPSISPEDLEDMRASAAAGG